MFMESPIGDRNSIDIKVEKYKQIVPDSYYIVSLNEIIPLTEVIVRH